MSELADMTKADSQQITPPEASAVPGRTSPKAVARPHGKRTRNLLMQFGVLVVILLLWQLTASQEWVNRILLPLPVDVWSALKHGIFDGLWSQDITTTLFETVTGFVIGVAIGLVVGAAFAFIAPLRTAFYPYVIAFMSMPKIAIAPLLIVALGYDATPKVVIAALLAFFPVMSSATAGLTEVDPDELNLMRAMGASKARELRYLRLPNAMSYVFPSLDVALVGALLGAVAAELVGAKHGLGYVLTQAQAYGDIPGIYGALILLAIIGSLLRVVVVVVRRLLPVSIVPK